MLLLKSLGLLFFLFILLLLFEEGRSLENLLLLLLLGTEDAVRVVRPARVALALAEGSVPVAPVGLIGCVFT